MIKAPTTDVLFDVAVVGSGPAGLATSVYGGSEGLSIVCLDTRRFRRPGRRQRTHRKLSRLPDRHIGTGIDGACVFAGAEVRCRDGHSRRGEVARLFAQERRFRAHGERWRRSACTFGGDRDRRALPPPEDRRLGGIRGTRRVVLGVADRGSLVSRRGSVLVGGGIPPGRRRCFSPITPNM